LGGRSSNSPSDRTAALQGGRTYNVANPALLADVFLIGNNRRGFTRARARILVAQLSSG